MANFPPAPQQPSVSLQAATPRDFETPEKSTRMPSVSEQWDLAWEEFGRRYPRLRHGAILTNWLVFNGSGLSVLVILSFLSGLFPWWSWALMLLSTITLSQMFISKFSGESYNRKISALQERMRPNLSIDYRPLEGEPFVQESGGVTQFRVSVRSPVPTADAELVVNHIKIPQLTTTLFDMHLRPMHDRDQVSGTKRVALKATREKFWDLACVFDAPPQGRCTVYLTCIPSLGVIELMPGDYKFELMATGGDRPEATKIVILKIGGNYRIASIDIRDGRLSSLPA